MKSRLLVLTAGVLLAANCAKKQSTEAFLEDYGKKMCYKAVECAQEKMKDIPEEQRAMMESMIPTRGKCDKAQEEYKKKQASEEGKKIELSSAEMELGKKCLDSMTKSSCDEMQSTPDECVEFNKVMATKQ